MDLGKKDLDALKLLAAEKSPAQYYAQNILSFLTGIDIARPIEKWDEEPEERTEGQKESSLPTVFANNLEIQPNPATETVFVRWRTDIGNTSGSLELWNMNGRLLERTSIHLTEGTEQVNIGHLPPGVYIFRIRGAGYSSMQKFVVE